jgi:hypothetical protein
MTAAVQFPPALLEPPGWVIHNTGPQQQPKEGL